MKNKFLIISESGLTEFKELDIDSLFSKITELETKITELESEISILKDTVNQNSIDITVNTVAISRVDSKFSNYFTKTQLTNYSTSLKLAKNTNIGNSDDYCFTISNYGRNQVYIKFITPDSNGEGKIIGPNDQIINCINGSNWVIK